MKLINLILYSENIPEYIEMKNILEKYLEKLTNFVYYFYCFDEALETDYKIKNNTIYIKGKDTFLPGILDKTIKAFEIIKELNIEYDYLIRTNISSVVNFPLLQQYLLANSRSNIDYAGQIKVLTWQDIPCGIINNKYYNTPFVTGICIILSKNLVSLILEKKHELDYSIVDDVSISVLCKRNNILCHDLEKFVIENPVKFYHSKIIFRNKSQNRDNDVSRMLLLVNNLIDNITVQNMM